jgi:hypothetical protein
MPLLPTAIVEKRGFDTSLRYEKGIRPPYHQAVAVKILSQEDVVREGRFP